jgi:hypothetical protein
MFAGERAAVDFHSAGNGVSNYLAPEAHLHRLPRRPVSQEEADLVSDQIGLQGGHGLNGSGDLAVHLLELLGEGQQELFFPLGGGESPAPLGIATLPSVARNDKSGSRHSLRGKRSGWG